MPGPAHFSARTKARKQALDILFQADLLGHDPILVLREARLDSTADRPLREFAMDLVEGVASHRGTIDQAIEQNLDEGWSLDRMPRVDRCLARLAGYEILRQVTPARVAIAEALILAGELSTDESPAFLNGVLSAIARRQPLQQEEVEQVHETELTTDPATDPVPIEGDETD